MCISETLLHVLDTRKMVHKQDVNSHGKMMHVMRKQKEH